MGAFDGSVLVGTMAVSRRVSAQVWPYLWPWGLYARKPYRSTSASRLLAEAVLVKEDQQAGLILYLMFISGQKRTVPSRD